MARLSFKVDVGIEPLGAIEELEVATKKIANKISKDKRFWEKIWIRKTRFVGKEIAKNFPSPGWPDITEKYKRWKDRAVGRVRVSVGKFKGKFIVMYDGSFKNIGKRTGTMHQSATGGAHGMYHGTSATVAYVEGENPVNLVYGIDLNLLPYAKRFNEKREFFYLKTKAQRELLKWIANDVAKEAERMWLENKK